MDTNEVRGAAGAVDVADGANVANAVDVLAALRHATQARHAVLDARTPMAVARPDLRAYRDHLAMLRAWLAPLRAWLAGFDDGPAPHGCHGDLGGYLRLIEADLADAALAGLPAADAPAAAQAAAAPPAPWPARADAAYRWGVCYVVEGSQLGGAVLYKRHGARLAPHPLAYFRGDGAPGPRWQRFLAALRAAVTTPEQVEQACLGAQRAFDALLALVALNGPGDGGDHDNGSGDGNGSAAAGR